MGDGSTMTELSIGLVIGQLHRGGAETQLVKLALGLHERDVRVVVYCLSNVTEPHADVLTRAGILVRTLPDLPLGTSPRWLRLRKQVREDQVQIIHSFLLGPAVHTAIALLGIRRTAFIASNRTCDMQRPLMRRLLEAWALRRASMVTVNSTPAIEFTGNYYFLRKSKIKFIANGVGPLSDLMPSRKEARESLNLRPDAQVILGLFRLSPEKELEVFCRTVERTFKDLPSAQCLIAGDGPLREWLEKRIADSPIRTQFRLLGPRDDVPTLLAAVDLLLLTSSFEGMPNGVLEAMSAGLPVVATHVGGLVDLVEPGKTGHLCPAGDRDKLASACMVLLQDPARAREMGRQASTQCKERFGVEKMVQTYLDLYRDL